MSRLEFCREQRKKHPERYFIHPSVNIPSWVKVGEDVRICEGCTIGSQGFGFARSETFEPLHIPHTGKLIIGDRVEIYEGSNICRGTIDDTIIGEGTKIDAHCHVGHNAKIGKRCLITAHCIVGGSCELGDNVYVGLNSTIKDHILIADNTFIGQGSNVVKDITECGGVWVGNPAKYVRQRRDDEG